MRDSQVAKIAPLAKNIVSTAQRAILIEVG
jgi:hypothetical protein